MRTYTIRECNKDIICVNFDNINEQYLYIKDFVQQDKFGTVTEVSSDDTFFGNRPFKETYNGMLYGFSDDTQYFLDSIADVKKQTDSNSGEGLSTEGYAYDMFSVVNNIPECCLAMDYPDTKPYIKIMVDICFSCWYTVEQIRNRGIAIANLINTLLLNGCIVDLYFMEYNIQSDKSVLYAVKVDTNVLSISDIAFLCSPEYFRKISFITVDKIRDKESESGRGYSELTDFLIRKISKDKLFFIGGSYTNKNLSKKLDTLESANNYILELFKLYCDENKIIISLDKTKQ